MSAVPSDKVLVSKTKYAELKKASKELEALYQGGVSDWEWYDASLEQFRREERLEDSINDAMTDLLIELSEHIDAPAGHEAGYSICGDEPYEIVLKFIETVEKLKKEAAE